MRRSYPGEILGITAVLPVRSVAGPTWFRWLDSLAENSRHNLEIVSNDWGTLNSLSKRYGDATIVAGRLLCKMLRDPRADWSQLATSTPSPVVSALRHCAVSNAAYRDLLAEMGVGRIEMDYPLQGLGLHFAETGLRASVYAPFGCATAGRICQLGSLGLEKGQKFTSEALCQWECHRYCASLTDTSRPYDQSRPEIWLFGNAVFYRIPDEHLENLPLWVRDHGVDRIVWWDPRQLVGWGMR